MMTYILFIIGFVLLIKGADLLVDGASSIAKKLRISAIVIGLTIVSFGTSAPEMIVNVLASISGNTDIAIGNILGSNMANILLILGISAVIYPVQANKNTVWKEIPFGLLAALVLVILASDKVLNGAYDSVLSRGDGLILLSFFIIFLYYTFSISKANHDDTQDDNIQSYTYIKSFAYILGGLVALFFGGKWIVDGAVSIAEYFGLSQSLIGLTIVAIGTSLPELATSAVAAYKKQSDIAIGNIVGSNIFNIFFILGISSIINDIPFSSDALIDAFITMITTFILFVVMFIGKRHIIERGQGIVFIICYIVYLLYLILIRNF